MTDFIDQPQFESIQQRYRSGDLAVSMPRQIARQFFLLISNQDVKRTTGKSIIFKKGLIWLMNISSPLLFLACLAMIAINEGPWVASLAIPVAGICWTVIYGLTSDQGGWLVGTIPLVLSAIPMLDGGDATFFVFVLSIWLQRSSYLASTAWLMDIVMNSFDAFEMMQPHLSIDTD